MSDWKRRRTSRAGLPGPVLPDHSGRQLDDRPRRHGLRAERPLPDAGRARPDGAVRRADDRHRAGAARSGAAPAGRRHSARRDRRRRGDFRGACAAVAGDRLGRGVPAVGIGRLRGLYAARAPPPGAGGGRLQRGRAGGRIRSSSSGSPSARSISWSARSSASSGWCCLAIPFVAYLRRRDERLGLHPA